MSIITPSIVEKRMLRRSTASVFLITFRTHPYLLPSERKTEEKETAINFRLSSWVPILIAGKLLVTARHKDQRNTGVFKLNTPDKELLFNIKQLVKTVLGSYDGKTFQPPIAKACIFRILWNAMLLLRPNFQTKSKTLFNWSSLSMCF